MLASVKVTSYTTWGLWRNSFHCEWSRKGMSSPHISDVRDCETEWVWCVTDDHMRAQARQVPRSFIAHSSGSSRHYGNPPILSGQNWSEGKGQKENRIKKKKIIKGEKKKWCYVSASWWRTRCPSHWDFCKRNWKVCVCLCLSEIASFHRLMQQASSQWDFRVKQETVAVARMYRQQRWK